MKLDTVVTSKGTTTIPDPLRRELGISAGTVITWSLQDGKLVGLKKTEAQNAMQAHIRKYAGTWKGISAVLKRTRS